MRGRLRRCRALGDVVPVFLAGARGRLGRASRSANGSASLSNLYDYHFEERRRRSYGNAQSTPILEPAGRSSTLLDRRQRTYSQPAA
jgi:hypothetical protein